MPATKRPHDRRSAEYAVYKTFLDSQAQAAWEAMDEDERMIVRVGMTPLHIVERFDGGEFQSPDFAVALMGIAEENGGMVV